MLHNRSLPTSIILAEAFSTASSIADPNKWVASLSFLACLLANSLWSRCRRKLNLWDFINSKRSFSWQLRQNLEPQLQNLFTGSSSHCCGGEVTDFGCGCGATGKESWRPRRSDNVRSGNEGCGEHTQALPGSMPLQQQYWH